MRILYFDVKIIVKGIFSEAKKRASNRERENLKG